MANRLSKIHKKTKVDQWRFVDSELNPADHCSRGIKAHEKEKWKVYLEGPEFLRNHEDQWPNMKVGPPDQCTVKAMTTSQLVRTEEEERWIWWYERFSAVSGWERKKRLMTKIPKWIMRWRCRASTLSNGESEEQRAEAME